MRPKVKLYSRDTDYRPFNIPDESGGVLGGRYTYENAVLELGKCVGIEYDTQLIGAAGHSISAISSEDDYYFLKTRLLLEWIGDERPS